MRVEIITPDKSLHRGEAKSVTLPGLDGSLGVLDNHAPMIASLKAGTIKLTEISGQVHTFPIRGGVAEVLKNKVIILAE